MNQQAIGLVIAGALIAAAIALTNHWTLSIIASNDKKGPQQVRRVRFFRKPAHVISRCEYGRHPVVNLNASA